MQDESVSNGNTVHIVLGLDTRAGHGRTRDVVNDSIKNSLDSIRGTLNQINSIQDINVILFTYGTETHQYHGIHKLEDLPAVMDRLPCKPGITTITRMFDELNKMERTGEIPVPRAVILLGDTVEQWSRIQYLSEHGVINDLSFIVKKAAQAFGKPVITLCDNTTGKASHADVHLMNTFSKATGVYDCPVLYEKQSDFAQQFLNILIASSGPEALQEAFDKGLINLENTNLTQKQLNNIATATTNVEEARWRWPLKRSIYLAFSACVVGIATAVTMQFNQQTGTIAPSLSEPQAQTAPAPKTKQISFEGNSDTLSTHSQDVVDSLSAFINANPGVRVAITGKKASALKDKLIESGISASAIFIKAAENNQVINQGQNDIGIEIISSENGHNEMIIDRDGNPIPVIR